MFASLRTFTNILTNVGSTTGSHKFYCRGDKQVSITPFPQTPEFAKFIPALKTKKEPFLLSTKMTKQLVTTANCGNLCLLWSYWRLIPFQLIASSPAGTLSLCRYAQMSSALTTQLYAHFWTWHEKKIPSNMGQPTQLHVHTDMQRM